MPEETTGSESTTSAADIHAEILAEQNSDKETADADNDEAKTETEDDETDSSVTADEDHEDDDETDADEVDEDDLPLTSKLALSDNIREKFPEEAKRWDQQVKGLQKLEKRLSDNADAFDGYTRLDAALQDKKTAPEAFKAMAKFIAEKTELSIEDLLGVATTQDDDKDPTSKYGLSHASDDKVVDLLMKKVVEDLGVDPALLKDLKSEHEQKKQNEADKTWFQQKGSAILAKVEKTAGWKVTQEQVIGAKNEYPDLFKSDPILALKKHDPDSYEARKKPAKREGQPDMLKGTTGKGPVLPENPLEWTARDAGRSVGALD